LGGAVRRREFITWLGGTAMAWPLAARAQQPAMPVIGFLGSESPELFADRLRAFRQGLNETGYVEGRNVAIEYRWAEGQYDRLPALAADLVRQQVTVIAAAGPAALPAKAATRTIPVVFQTASDPVEVGLVASLNRPGGNVTGVSSVNTELGPKRLELLHELVPAATTIALLLNPTARDAGTVTVPRDLQAAALTLGLQLHVLYASTEREFDTVFATLVQLRVGALIISPAAFFSNRSEQLAVLSLRHGVAAIHPYREFATAGGLISYGGSFIEPFGLIGVYTGRILNGEKPADLPVQQPTKIELTVNLKTAKALGITVPLALLTRADEVIE
jgi:putative tryptophan/tyrosine transport system substrate-binding protein